MASEAWERQHREERTARRRELRRMAHQRVPLRQTERNTRILDAEFLDSAPIESEALIPSSHFPATEARQRSLYDSRTADYWVQMFARGGCSPLLIPAEYRADAMRRGLQIRHELQRREHERAALPTVSVPELPLTHQQKEEINRKAEMWAFVFKGAVILLILLWPKIKAWFGSAVPEIKEAVSGPRFDFNSWRPE